MERSDFTLPPLEWIRAFEAAARLGSFTEAARETGLTQSAISQRIAHLERALGTMLFHRRARAISLTLEGEAWLPYVQTSLDGLRDSSEALFGIGRSRLTISASQSVIALWLLPRLAGMRAATGAPISVQTLVLGAHQTPPEGIVSIRYGTGDWPHRYKAQLFAEEIAPLVSPGLISAGQDWISLPRIAFSGPRPGWKEWAARFGVPTTPVATLRFDTFQPALDAARAGQGVVLASLPLSQADIAAGNLVRAGDDILGHHASYWMIADRDAISQSQWDRLCALF